MSLKKILVLAAIAAAMPFAMADEAKKPEVKEAPKAEVKEAPAAKPSKKEQAPAPAAALFGEEAK